jgi:hypothetical protein
MRLVVGSAACCTSTRTPNGTERHSYLNRWAMARIPVRDGGTGLRAC